MKFFRLSVYFLIATCLLSNFVLALSFTFEATVAGSPIINNDCIPSSPLINVMITTTLPLNIPATKMSIDNNPVTPVVIAESATKYSVSYQVTSPLSDALHSISLEATDGTNTDTWEATGLRVKTAGAVEMLAIPLNYPNPFDPATGTAISFYLTRDSNIQINIYDVSGNLIAKKVCASGAAGGKAGYNEVLWNGINDSGNFVGNGMYLYFILSGSDMIGKGKMVAFR